MHTAPVSWREEKNVPPAATIAFVTARFPLPISPNTTSPPSRCSVRPTTSETSIRRKATNVAAHADRGALAAPRRRHRGRGAGARGGRHAVADALRRPARRPGGGAGRPGRRAGDPPAGVRGRAGGRGRRARRLPAVLLAD